MRTPILLCVPLLLSACAGSGDTRSNPTAGAEIGQAATAPLSDLNIVRADIPQALRNAQKGGAYARPADTACPALVAEVEALDAALGNDLDHAADENKPGALQRGAGAVGGAAVGALRGAAEDVVPFRGWVRKLTGAERYSKEVAAAIEAGTVRRAYLKGLGESLACPAPAAPRR
jgi:hypothetical protein